MIGAPGGQVEELFRSDGTGRCPRNGEAVFRGPSGVNLFESLPPLPGTLLNSDHSTEHRGTANSFAKVGHDEGGALQRRNEVVEAPSKCSRHVATSQPSKWSKFVGGLRRTPSKINSSTSTSSAGWSESDTKSNTGGTSLALGFRERAFGALRNVFSPMFYHTLDTLDEGDETSVQAEFAGRSVAFLHAMSMATNRQIPRRKNRAAVELHAYLTAQFNNMDKDLSGLVRIEALQELAFHSSAVPRFFGYSPPVAGVPRVVDVVRGASGEQREQEASGVQMSSSSRESTVIAIRDWNEGEGACSSFFAPDLLAEDARWTASLERWKEKLDPKILSHNYPVSWTT